VPFFAYPAAPSFFCALLLCCYLSLHLPCCDIIFRLPCCALIFFFSHSCCAYLLCPYFSAHLPCCAYPAGLLFFFALTLLCPYFSSHLPCCAFCALIFSSRLPCCALNFLRTYPAPPLFYFHLPCCPLIFILLRTNYPAVPLIFNELLLYSVALFFCALTLLLSLPRGVEYCCLNLREPRENALCTALLPYFCDAPPHFATMHLMFMPKFATTIIHLPAHLPSHAILHDFFLPASISRRIVL